MNTPRPLMPLLLLALSTCRVADDDSGDEQVDPVIAAQLELCIEVCGKPFSCDGTLEPGPHVDEECEARCTETVGVAQDDDCTEEYQDMMECVNGLSCDDFESWWGDETEHETPVGCEAELQALELNCPNVHGID